MKISALSRQEFARRARGPGIVFRAGRYVTRLRSPLPDVVAAVWQLYVDYGCEEHDAFVDFHVEIVTPRNARRWLRPQVLFRFDGRPPFKPLPRSQAFPFFEWGLNWCISNHFNDNLIIHAAVVERNGVAAILPGAPGAGKSTLCAALVCRGWRLLSDELAIVRPAQLDLLPVPRPVSLKNESIDIIRQFAPAVTLGKSCPDTTKGTVAHMKAPAQSVERLDEPARPAWIIIPDYEAGAQPQLEPVLPGRTFMHTAQQTFNYNRLGRAGFDILTRLVDQCDCYSFRYSRLDDAIATFDALSPSAH